MELLGASQLESYLGHLRQEGQLDSSGRFTISSAEHFRKLGQLSTAHAIRWVFFATQSAVAMGATRSRLSVSQDTVSVSWEVEEPPLWSRDGTALADFSERYSSDPAYDFLRQGLLWALAQQPRFLSLLLEGPAPGFVIELGLEKQKFKPLLAKKQRSTQFSLVFEPKNADRRFRRPDVRGAFHAEASFRLAFCPMPVFFDGQELSQGKLENLTKSQHSPSRAGKSFFQVLLEKPGSANLAVSLPSIQGKARNYWVAEHPVVSPPGDDFEIQNFRIASEEIADLPLQDFRMDRPPEVGEITLASYLNPQGMRRQLKTRVPWDAGFPMSGFSRLRARAVLAKMRVRSNTLLLSHYGLILDPVRSLNIAQEGWVGLVATDELACDASGTVAIDGPQLQHLKQWMAGQCEYWKTMR